jgi:hypothetical protein
MPTAKQLIREQAKGRPNKGSLYQPHPIGKVLPHQIVQEGPRRLRVLEHRGGMLHVDVRDLDREGIVRKFLDD